jgi:competence protein ComEC
MTAGVLAFVSGVVLLQVQSALPAAAWLWGLPACLALGAWRPGLRVAAAFAAGFLWAAGWAHLRMADRLAPELEGRELQVTGVISGLPAAGERALRFEFEPETAPPGVRLPRRLRLAWYAAAPAAPVPEAHPGERWRFTLRLRHPHGQVNPHGFDYEAWLLERGTGATGYVRAYPPPLRLGVRDSALDRIEQAREAVRARFLRVLGATPAAGILAALAIGDQRAISSEEWRLFRRTGVTHLMSISGLHVTLVSGLIAWLVGFGWRRLPRLCLALPARKAAAAAAAAAALGYTLLAGFGVPAQRTLLMVCVVALALWSGRVVSPSRTLALALGAVVLADPWAPLAPGFWLSFGAVALIFYVAAGWTGAERKLTQWGRIQWAVTLGLAPAALVLFGQVSLVGPLANAVAIPLVSAVVTPLALLGAVLPLEAVLQLAAWLAERLLEFLEACAALPLAVWQTRSPAPWAVLLAPGWPGCSRRAGCRGARAGSR